ncbi:hypothetical protein D7X94_13580 [Acutalibacter sp. 1XD8-33]|uniref:hypothetical protein n=1 Tax=Acutalibacter sp. 1XD8-33 TaxID=2320081 RepID=UPI000EA12E13|nr:hypothetical protein [Acutalibacter sp. 1XD8-33]RKJ39168.1 hypothetical protein D7X94_13580 [Acutalibacter sp. 1XD8-33]
MKKRKWLIGGVCALALVLAVFLLIANFWMETVEFQCTMVTDSGREPIKATLTYNLGADWLVPIHLGQWYHAANIRGTLTGTAGNERKFQYELFDTLEHQAKDPASPLWPYCLVWGSDPAGGPLLFCLFRKDSGEILFVTKEMAVFAAGSELKGLMDEINGSSEWRKWREQLE